MGETVRVPSQSFTKCQRLLKRSEFTETMNLGDKVVSRYFVMFGRTTEKRTNNRVGLIVSKKNGTAVIRNRIKRHLREAYRKAAIKSTLAGCDIVLIARYRAVDASQIEISDALNACIRRLSRTCENSGKPLPKDFE